MPNKKQFWVATSPEGGQFDVFGPFNAIEARQRYEELKQAQTTGKVTAVYSAIDLAQATLNAKFYLPD